jgi:hypothetical protein
MKLHNRKIVSLAGMAGCFAILAGNFDTAAESKTNYVAKVMVAETNTDLIVPVGASARFEAPSKEGNKYQWVKNSTGIEGATNSFYLISAVTKEDVGFYRVLVTSGSQYPEDFISCTTTLSAYNTTNKGQTLELYAPMSGSITNPTGGVIGGGGTRGNCPSNYCAYVKFKDPSTGSYWWPRPTGTMCTITDQNPSYTTKVEAVESGTLSNWCNIETVTFPTKPPPTRYQFTTYFTTCNPPYAGEIVGLLINWF